MKRVSKTDANQKAKSYYTSLIAAWGLKSADLITLALRRLIIEEKKRRKTLNKKKSKTKRRSKK